MASVMIRAQVSDEWEFARWVQESDPGTACEYGQEKPQLRIDHTPDPPAHPTLMHAAFNSYARGEVELARKYGDGLPRLLAIKRRVVKPPQMSSPRVTERMAISKRIHERHEEVAKQKLPAVRDALRGSARPLSVKEVAVRAETTVTPARRALGKLRENGEIEIVPTRTSDWTQHLYQWVSQPH